VDGVLPLTALTLTAARPGDRPAAEPKAQLLEVDFPRARGFGGDTGATGIRGPTPSPGEVVVGEDLAETLGVGAGDVVEIYAYGGSLSLRVVRTLPRVGVAGLVLGEPGSASPTLFVAPGTAAPLARAGRSPAAPPAEIVAVSLTGGVLAGADATSAVVARLHRALRELPVNVQPVKADVLAAAEETGEQFTRLFAMIGLFSVLAGILLLVNIFVMLAQERQAELGTLRAVGLRRSSLVGAFSLEGWLYTLASAVVGSVAGIVVGRLIVVVAADIFSRGDVALELVFTATRASVEGGLTIGFVIALLTVAVTSARISRLNVIRAIRDLPEPTASRPRDATLVLALAALAVGGWILVRGVVDRAPGAVLVGPCLLATGLVRVLHGVAPRRVLVSAASAAVLGWAVFAFDVLPGVFRNPEIELFVVQGVILTAAAVALVSQNQETIGAALGRVGGRSTSLVLRLGLAYPLARRFRTGMTLTMYALVVYTLASITVFSDLFGGQVDDFTRRISGGFDLVVESNAANPLPVDGVAGRPDVGAVAALSTAVAEWDAPVSDGFEPWPVASFDEALVRHRPPRLEERAPAYPDDAAAYRAVLADPSLVVVSEFFLQAGGGPPERPLTPGDAVTMRDPLSGRSRRLTVAAVADSAFGNIRSLVAPPAFSDVFGDRSVPNLLHVATAPGADPEEVASSINGAFIANGADARSFRSVVSENLAQQLSFFRLMQGYLALGLLVGVAGLGVVMVRAVRERRRQVGVLRALGFEAAAVRRTFVTESAFVAVEGITIGIVLAVLTAWRLVSSDTFGAELAFSVPLPELGLLFAGTLLASLVATAAPAQQASRIRPAVALRITD
jgi:putative ABC transport system permease protein